MCYSETGDFLKRKWMILCRATAYIQTGTPESLSNRRFRRPGY